MKQSWFESSLETGTANNKHCTEAHFGLCRSHGFCVLTDLRVCRRVGVESAAVDARPAGPAGVHPPVLSEPNRGASG